MNTITGSSYKNLRLKNYNYSCAGFYFITICTNYKQNILCNITLNNMEPHFSGPEIIITNLGIMVEKYINNIPIVYDNAAMDCYIIMPNHIHFILSIISNKDKYAQPGISLPKIVNSLKTLTSKEAGFTIWQKNYYEHIIRNEQELDAIREYIKNNPFKWCDDDYYIDH